MPLLTVLRQHGLQVSREVLLDLLERAACMHAISSRVPRYLLPGRMKV